MKFSDCLFLPFKDIFLAGEKTCIYDPRWYNLGKNSFKKSSKYLGW